MGHQKYNMKIQFWIKFFESNNQVVKHAMYLHETSLEMNGFINF